MSHPRRLLLALAATLATSGCVLDRRGQSSSAAYERELRKQGARLSSLEQQFDDVDTRLTRVEELTQARGEQDLLKLQTLEQVRAEVARLRGEVELLRHDVDTHTTDAGRRLEDAAFRLGWLEVRAEQLEKSLGLAPPRPPSRLRPKSRSTTPTPRPPTPMARSTRARAPTPRTSPTPRR